MKIQAYADKRDMRAFYEALKAAYGPSHQVQAPLRSTDGSTLLTSKDGIIARWAEHFKGLFSDQRFVEETSLAKIPQADVKSFLDNPPTCDEIKEAIAKLKHGNSKGKMASKLRFTSMEAMLCSEGFTTCSPSALN